MNKQEGNNKSNFVLQGMILASASIIVRLIGLFYRIPLTNILGNDGNAFYSNAFEIYNIALLLSSYSVPLAVSKLVSIRMERKQTENAYRVFKVALIFTGTIGFIVASFTYIFAPFISNTIMKMPMSVYALKVLAPCLFIVAILGVIRGFFQGMGTTVPTAFSQIIEQIINAVVSIVAATYLFHVGKELNEANVESLIPSAYGAAGGTLGTVSGALAALIFMTLIFFSYRKVLKKRILREKGRSREGYSDIFKILIITILPVIFSAGIANLNSIVGQAIYNNIMVYKGYSEAEYANLWGIFSGKYRVILNIPMGVSSALAAAFIPTITAAAISKNNKLIKQKIALAVKFNMIIVVPCFVAFLLYANEILFLLFNDDTIIASNILRIGCLSLIFVCLSTITTAVLQGFNKMMIPVMNGIKALVAHIISVLVMLYFFNLNIYAVVLADVLFALILCYLNLNAVGRITKYKIHLGEAFILPLIASLSMGIVSYAGFLVFGLFLPRKITFVFSIVIALVTYGISLLKFQIVEERDLLGIPGGTRIVRILDNIGLL